MGNIFRGGFISFFELKALKAFAIMLATVACFGVWAGSAQAAYGDEASSSEETYEITVTGTYHQTEARSMLAMLNEFRTAKVDHSNGNTPWYKAEDGSYVDVEGLSELKWDYGLEKVAMQRAAEAALLSDHARPNGINSRYLYVENYKIDGYGHYGENLAQETTEGVSVSAARTFKAWREDSLPYKKQGHRRAMLEGGYKSYPEMPCVGVACLEVGSTVSWVMVFGYETDCGSFDSNDSQQTVTFASLPTYLQSEAVSKTVKAGTSISLARTSWTSSSKYSFCKPTFYLASKSCQEIRWTSSNESVASVEDGVVVTKEPGTATISALDGNLTMNLTVTAKQTPTLSGIPTTDSVALSAGTYRLSPSCDSTGAKSFDSSDKSVATVGADGTVTLKKAGTTTITVSYAENDDFEAASASCKLTVTDGSNSSSGSGSWTKDPDKGNSWFTPDGTQVIVTPAAATVSAPAKASITRLAKAKKAFTVKWKKRSGVTGYQVRYSLKSSMKGAKTVTVKSAKTTAKKVTKLKKKKKYYVQVRTYKVVNGKTYWSGWSAKKSVKTK